MTDFSAVMAEVRRVVMGMMAMAGQHRVATITAVDPTGSYAVKVMLQPEGVESGWIPVKAHAVGSGWGIACLPNINDQVLIAPAEAHAEQGIVVGTLYNDTQRAPAAQAGEFVLVHKLGAFVKLTNDGKLSMQDASGASILFSNNGTIAVSANNGLSLHTQGALTVHSNNFTLDSSGNLTTTGGVTAGQDTIDQVTLQHHTHSHGSPPDPGT